MLPSACNDSVGALIARFRSSMPIPPIPLFMLHRPPRGDRRKTRGRADRYSFLVRLSHSLRHAGLSRRSVTPPRRSYGPSRHRLAFDRFPGGPVIRPTLLPPFLEGTRTVSPVAQHALVTLLSLPPRRSKPDASVRLRHAMLPSPRTKGLGLRYHFFNEAPRGFTPVTAR